MELKEKCKYVREKIGMSQKDFAERFLDTNQTEISFIERGFIPENRNKIETINRLYRCFVKLDSLDKMSN